MLTVAASEVRNSLVRRSCVYVTVYRKTGHNAAPFEKIFLHLQSCWRPDIELSKFYRCNLSRSHYNIDLTVPFRRLETIHFKEIDRSFLDIYARRVVPGFPVDSHIYTGIYVGHNVQLRYEWKFTDA